MSPVGRRRYFGSLELARRGDIVRPNQDAMALVGHAGELEPIRYRVRMISRRSLSGWAVVALESLDGDPVLRVGEGRLKCVPVAALELVERGHP